MQLNDLSYSIRSSIYKLHSTLGPGLLESVYEAALIHELMNSKLQIVSQVGLPVKKVSSE